jgi:MFS-type transporter involved in bile tolerance (Atg22 family)
VVAAEAALWYETRGWTTVLAEQNGQRIALITVAAFLLIGLILLLFVDESKARAAAQAGSDGATGTA